MTILYLLQCGVLGGTLIGLTSGWLVPGYVKPTKGDNKPMVTTPGNTANSGSYGPASRLPAPNGDSRDQGFYPSTGLLGDKYGVYIAPLKATDGANGPKTPRWVPYDPDWAAIGLIEPEFVDEEASNETLKAHVSHNRSAEPLQEPLPTVKRQLKWRHVY